MLPRCQFQLSAQEKVYNKLFDLTDEAEMGHIELSRSSDLIVVVPASADFIAKTATGQANDLASTLILATDTKVLDGSRYECSHVGKSS